MTINNTDGRIKLTRKIEIKIVAMLRQWNSKITNEFGKAKSRYNGVNNLSPSTAKQISAGDVNYYEKYMNSLQEKEVMQEMLDEQYALIEKIFKNAEEIPNLSVERLIRDRPEDMA